ncbi:cobalamin biosynthesis protein CobQ [Sulfitobacter aestuariivivens]|uniref:Cobalamin biosynthesis protein CobQ n=1 Tax=Sulfitobacter aestuariivivens TaxID=2766981 RepID=A0A927D3Q3_9RHOB|nr:cobalamin biosynthesis protein CobQ [Sulfitobacter aestuariivivens]MBD3662792.1 cobalamin biosynthesis protein CobQ [Sulfitobacter aestuariivivens]
MNTPAHLLIGAAAMGRNGDRLLIWAAMTGALLPDLSLYLLAGASLFIFQIPPDVVFDTLYFSDTWQTIFAIDNSFILWGALFGLALWYRVGWAIALTGAALLHLALDFPLHHDDGRPHFWPLSGWIFESPVSYWDNRRGALWVGPIEVALAGVCAFVLWRRRPGWVLSVLLAALLAAELMVARVWMFVFTA